VNGPIPTIGAIQRTNLVVAVLVAAALAWLDSIAAGAACLLAGAIVIVNLYVLSGLGYVVIAAARGGSGLAVKLGTLLLPLKLLIMAGLVYLLFLRVHIDAIGFATGVLTQMLAVIIETGRAVHRAAA
jgi:hypothetical protein